MSDSFPESFDPDSALDELARKRLWLAMAGVLGFIAAALPIELHYDAQHLGPYLAILVVEIIVSVLALVAVRNAPGHARDIAAVWAGLIGLCVAAYYPLSGGDATLAMTALICLVSAVPALLPFGARHQVICCALCWLGLLGLFVAGNPASLPWPYMVIAFLAVTSMTSFGAGSLDHFRREALRREAMLHRTHEDLRMALGRAHGVVAERSRMIASVSHEFRTPVNVIVGYADMLLDPAAAPENAHRLVERIRENAVSLDALVTQLLDFSRLSCGKFELRREEIDVPSLLEEVAHGARLLVRDKPLRVSVDCRARRLRSDPMRLRQILHNLITNAARFTDRGRIEIRAREERDRVVFEVSDTGCGIPKDRQEDIFTAFEQLPQSGAERGGIGLGLAIVRQLTDLLGGAITVSSVAGSGSTFTVVLPDSLERQPIEEVREVPSAAA